MSKRDPTRPGVFTAGIKARHFRGKSAKAKRLAKKAESARTRQINWLRRKYPNNPDAKLLAKKLTQCRPKRRCSSGACPVCAQAAQELFVELARGLGHESKGRETEAVRRPVRPMTVTLVLPGLTSKPGELGDPTIKQAHRRMVDHMAKAKVHLGVGVLEVCLIQHVDGRYPTAWGWHIHGVAFTRNPLALSKRLSKAFPTSDAVPRPVRVVPWDGNPKWLRYCHKIAGRCRVGIDDQIHYDVRKQQPRISRGTKARSLTANERLEFLLFHDKNSLDSRILVKGAQLRSTKKGARIVKLRRPKR